MSDRPGSSVWRSLRWPLVGIAGIVAFVLGRIGFAGALAASGTAASNADVTYLSLQLFTLESGAYQLGDLPWELHVARILAPLTTATALIAGLLAIFRQEVEEFRLRRLKNHVVVAGLGRRGSVLAVRLAEAGYKVVGIEADPVEARIAVLRRMRIPVIHGDARELETLRRARVGEASDVIAVTDADDVNADIALQSGAEASPERKRPLMCHAHIQDPELCILLREEELAAGGHTAFRLDFFNVYDQAVRAWQEQHPPFTPGEAAHLLVVGLDSLGQSVVVESARLWQSDAASRNRLRVTVVDPDVDSIVVQLEKRYPQLAKAVDIRAVPVDPLHLTCGLLPLDPSPTVVHVCLKDDAGAVETALMVRRCLSPQPTPVVVQLTQSRGLAGLLDRSGSAEIVPLYLFDVAMAPELLLGGTYEVLARQIHALYVEEQKEAGADESTNPSIRSWGELPDALKESNRDQSAHIGSKLRAIGCDIAPLSDWATEHFAFSSAELEMLAELEHERWMDQRLREGWKRGEKDVERGRSPHLVPWSELSDEVKDWDRRAVLHIPLLLAGAGYQVVRKPVRRG